MAAAQVRVSIVNQACRIHRSIRAARRGHHGPGGERRGGDREARRVSRSRARRRCSRSPSIPSPTPPTRSCCSSAPGDRPRPADLRHPFGHARYRYLYAYVVSLTVFWIGGVLAVIEGISTWPAPRRDRRSALGVRACWCWPRCSTAGRSGRRPGAGRAAKGDLTWQRAPAVTKAPELIVVFLEDLGALCSGSRSRSPA